MIETERLRLRRWDNSDIHQIHLLLADPDVMQFSETGALSAHDQMTWLQHVRTQQPKSALPGCVAIERRKDNRVIGYVSLLQDLARVQSRDVEIGFRLMRSVWGRGYAIEAAYGLIHATPLGGSFDRIVGIVDPANRRSVQVLKNLG
ncbi:MAG: GNAT family N-acetyltransferase [Tateyamaria sp.]|uniref:GNAT family N-acetyltransferase n=1 Tax=Tateyamaria sp. TaxID=1929288 RepID=UPI003284D17E